MSINLILGDSYERLKDLPDNSVDSIVTDPPYGLGSEPDPVALLRDWIEQGYHEVKGRGFMGKEWDAFVPQPSLWKECLRVLKPGGHLLSFFGTRTYDWGVLAIRIAGFEIRDQIGWIYGSGFPKSLDVSKAIDSRNGPQMRWFGPWLREERKRRGITQKELSLHFPSKSGGLTGCVANWELGLNIPTISQFNKLCEVMELPFEWIEDLERQVIGHKMATNLAVAPGQDNDRSKITLEVTIPTSKEARIWEGWGTALKPAFEPIVVARKPLEGTVAENVMKHSTGAINIDACRVDYVSPVDLKSATWGRGTNILGGNFVGAIHPSGKTNIEGDPDGRWPANIILDGSEEVEAIFPAEDGRSASRFFYCAKASKSDREEGLHSFDLISAGVITGRTERSKGLNSPRAGAGRTEGGRNIHPTVKPTALMRYLVRLVTPPGGTVLDPFMGSGSTGRACKLEGFSFIGIELEPDYYEIASARIESATNDPAEKRTKEPDIDPDQISMFSIDGF